MSEGVRTSLSISNEAARSTEPLVALERLPDGAFAEVEAVVDGDAESLILYRDGDHVRAWLNICPHAGRRLDWAPGQFLKSKDGHLVCAAHGASFELVGGECVGGPCRGESLRAVGVAVRDGAVWLLD
ncbi:Rieske (2Fe-2S) protein [Lysobacter arvi]|uniref:Rieske (2Fe-2S) protein n=1 Tax=Lysobacter arvi TaxID=3038776 RepID=A0ABU1CEG2_9GAMM|nr:Rieske (2Fe-2S) protein [Lysobacter arvi]MDR0182979.1 Rieske (2Fe-2S) protein [Lysobacter arvi]